MSQKSDKKENKKKDEKTGDKTEVTELQHLDKKLKKLKEVKKEKKAQIEHLQKAIKTIDKEIDNTKDEIVQVLQLKNVNELTFLPSDDLSKLKYIPNWIKLKYIDDEDAWFKTHLSFVIQYPLSLINKEKIVETSPNKFSSQLVEFKLYDIEQFLSMRVYTSSLNLSRINFTSVLYGDSLYIGQTKVRSLEEYMKVIHIWVKDNQDLEFGFYMLYAFFKYKNEMRAFLEKEKLIFQTGCDENGQDRSQYMWKDKDDFEDDDADN